jgi:hypothetical protein
MLSSTSRLVNCVGTTPAIFSLMLSEHPRLYKQPRIVEHSSKRLLPDVILVTGK